MSLTFRAPLCCDMQVGLPRKLFDKSGSVRCACVPESRLSDPMLSQYDGCSPTAVECVTAPPERK